MLRHAPMSTRSRRAKPGAGRAMGADPQPPVADPAQILALEVNRFGAGAPIAYRFAPTPFPLATGKISPALAMAALLIYQRRATEAYEQFQDVGSAQAIAQANAGFADPVGFVTSRLFEVVTTIRSFGDLLGLPAAEQGDTGSVGGVNTMILLAVGALALWMVMR